MAAVPAAAYLRVQATVAALLNVVVNPAIDWFSGRHKGSQPIWAGDGAVVNFVTTSLILSLLVGLFTAFGVRHEMRTGRVANDGTVTPPRWLSRLTRRGWLLGLMLGAGAAALIVAAFWLTHAYGVSRLSLGEVMVIKAAYCGVLGFLVARWVILRQLAPESLPKQKPGSRRPA
jgi:hypothetical protein